MTAIKQGDGEPSDYPPSWTTVFTPRKSSGIQVIERERVSILKEKLKQTHYVG